MCPGKRHNKPYKSLHKFLDFFLFFSGDKSDKTHLVAAGLWTDISARILKLPDLSRLHLEKLGGGTLALGYSLLVPCQ